MMPRKTGPLSFKKEREREREVRCCLQERGHPILSSQLTALSLQPFLSSCACSHCPGLPDSQHGVPCMHFLISLSKRTKCCFLLRDVDTHLYSGWYGHFNRVGCLFRYTGPWELSQSSDH